MFVFVLIYTSALTSQLVNKAKQRDAQQCTCTELFVVVHLMVPGVFIAFM